MKNTCETCRFWQPNISQATPINGECHIRPPQVVTNAGGETLLPARHLDILAAWPYTLHIDWCGEHEPKPIDKPNDTEGGE